MPELEGVFLKAPIVVSDDMGNAAAVKKEKCTCMACSCKTPDCKCTDICKKCSADVNSKQCKCCRKQAKGKDHGWATNLGLLKLRREERQLNAELKKLSSYQLDTGLSSRRDKQLDAHLKKLSSHKRPESQKEQSKDDASLPTLLTSFKNMERQEKKKRDGSLPLPISNHAVRDGSLPRPISNQTVRDGSLPLPTSEEKKVRESGSLPTLLVASRTPQAMVPAVGSKTPWIQSSNDKRKAYGRGKSRSLPLLEDQSLDQIRAGGGVSEYDATVASGTVLVLGGMKFYRKEPKTPKSSLKFSLAKTPKSSPKMLTSHDRRAAFLASKSKSLPIFDDAQQQHEGVNSISEHVRRRRNQVKMARKDSFTRSSGIAE